MGAKNHGIVMPDANENATLNAIVAAGFGAAGQRCMALSTIVFVGGAKSWYYSSFSSFNFVQIYVFHVCLALYLYFSLNCKMLVTLCNGWILVHAV